jgi:carboxyl-terminal processing protease
LRPPVRLALALLLASTANASPDDPVLARVDALVAQAFYSPAVLRERGWDAQVARADRRLRGGRSTAERAAVFRALLASLRTSHTEYFAADDPRHADLAAIFARVLADPARCPHESPDPPARTGIGAWWREIDGRWFVSSVFDGGIAQRAGLLRGDEVVSADGDPFAPVASFAGRAGQPVKLGVRRERRGNVATIEVVPEVEQPLALHAAATRDSARIIERGGRRIAYVHLWSGVGDAPAQARDAIRTLNARSPDAWILDLRDGWGGVPPDFVSIFDTRVPALVTTPRAGEPFHFDGQIRVPAAVVVDDSVRSGKEVLAHAVRRHDLATLVGSATPGALVAGTAYCLPDGALLYLATGTTTIDGQVLEGRGVQPEIHVPSDLRWASGADPQLDAALEHLARRRLR